MILGEHDAEGRDHAVERCVGKRQFFGISEAEFDAWPDMRREALAAASRAGEMSTPTTSAPAAAAFRADHPVPVATSSIFLPRLALSRCAAWASASEMPKLISL